MDEAGRGPFAIRANGSGNFRYGVAVALDSFEQLDDPGFSLALEHAIDRALTVLDDRARGKRGAVSTDADEAARQRGLGPLREVDDLRHIGQVVAGKGDQVG